jgi:hypothetical protein
VIIKRPNAAQVWRRVVGTEVARHVSFAGDYYCRRPHYIDLADIQTLSKLSRYAVAISPLSDSL